jgi:predicted nucleic acid-binding protein
MKYVLDACALIAAVLAEEGGHAVKDLIDSAQRGEHDVFMCNINLLEVYYGVLRDIGVEQAEEILESVKASSICVVGALDDGRIFREAGRIKASYKLSLADSVVIAYAASEDCVLVTSDHHEMDTIERNEKIKFLWIR